MSQQYIHIRGAKEHNLKSIEVKIPRDQLVVITGLSGSGKSSLAFDTIYAEGQRKYVESLSAYARQFLERMQKELSATQKVSYEALSALKKEREESKKAFEKLYAILQKTAPQVLQTTGRESSQRLRFQGPRPTGKAPS